MKKLLLVFLLSVIVGLEIYAQVNEPTFIGEVLLVDGGSTVCLEKQRASVETKAGVSMYIVGMGKISSKITIDKANSPIRLNPGEGHSFIVKTRDNNIDPISIVNFFKFIPTSSKKQFRYAEVSSLGTFSGASSANFDYIDFSAEKFGKSSYLLRVPPLELGEYGIIVNDPSMSGSKITVISCFGVGTVEEYTKVSDSEGYRYEPPLFEGD